MGNEFTSETFGKKRVESFILRQPSNKPAVIASYGSHSIACHFTTPIAIEHEHRPGMLVSIDTVRMHPITANGITTHDSTHYQASFRNGLGHKLHTNTAEISGTTTTRRHGAYLNLITFPDGSRHPVRHSNPELLAIEGRVLAALGVVCNTPDMALAAEHITPDAIMRMVKASPAQQTGSP